MTAQPRPTVPSIPDALYGLVDLALDMRWSWSHSSDVLWRQLAPEMWEVTHNPWYILQTISRTRLEEAANDREFVELLEAHVTARREILSATTWFEQTYPKTAGVPEAREITNTPDAGTACPPVAVGIARDSPDIAGEPNGPMGAPAETPAGPLGPIAYFSMEFGLSEALPIYSGGLGILAGDFLKAASDLGVPLVGVGLLWQQGYFRQALNAHGEQMEFYPFNDPGQLPIRPLRDAEGEWVTITLQFPRREVYLRGWEIRAGRVRLFLLDSNHLMNSPADRGITSELYGGGPEMRLQQEIALGIGGWRLLRELNITPDICHLNEGHAALAVLERARCHMQDHMQDRGPSFEEALTATRAGNLFTTHTPVEAGFDRFSPNLIAEYLGAYANELGIGLDRLLSFGSCSTDVWCTVGDSSKEKLNGVDSSEPFNMAYLAIRGSGAVNGVSRLHGEVGKGLFQCLFPRWPRAELPVGYVTNGIHVPSWDSEEADALWTRACGKGRWLGGLTGLGETIRQVSDEELWAFRDANRRKLVEIARKHVARQGPVAGSLEALADDLSCVCDPGILTLGFARRFATYKRANLLLHDQDRLERLLCHNGSRVQLVLAGKAHPADEAGKAMIRQWTEFISRCTVRPHVIFLVDYDMDIAAHLVHGVDVWINTPRRPWEASGTSGMKILVNGGLNLSELDGWWAEAYAPDVGWAIGDGMEHDSDPAWDAAEAGQLYELLENEIIPEFYDRDEHGIPRRWIARVRESMARLAPEFSTNRMMRDYLERYYLPGAAAYHERIAPPGPGVSSPGRAADIQTWRTMLAEHWDEIAFVDYSVKTEPRTEGDFYVFRAELALGSVPPEAILVELYAEPVEAGPPERHVLMMDTTTPAENVGSPESSMLPQLSATAGVPGSSGSHRFETTLWATRPASDYTPRVIPWHASARVPLEENHILWYR